MKSLIVLIISSVSWTSAVLFQTCGDGSIKPLSMSSDSCDETSDRCRFYAGSKFFATIQFIALSDITQLNLTTTFTDTQGATAYINQLIDCSSDATVVCPKKSAEGKLTLTVPVDLREPKVPFVTKVELTDQNFVQQFCFKFPGIVRPPIVL